ncbi:hypothetical protein BHM03_00038736 [Ensete ventricosum]|nr:hypothetical protein BHM03_00038736 [Ensete ventricosum]
MTPRPVREDVAAPRPTRGDEMAPCPARGDKVAPRSCMGRGGVASSRIASSRVGRGGVASSLRWETPVSTIPPGSERSTNQYLVGPVHTACTGRNNSKRKPWFVMYC